MLDVSVPSEQNIADGATEKAAMPTPDTGPAVAWQTPWVWLG